MRISDWSSDVCSSDLRCPQSADILFIHIEAQRNAETRRAERDGGRTDAPHIETRRLKRFRDPHRALVVTQDHRNDLAGGWRQVKTGADFLTGMPPQIRPSVAQIVGPSDPLQRSEERPVG